MLHANKKGRRRQRLSQSSCCSTTRARCSAYLFPPISGEAACADSNPFPEEGWARDSAGWTKNETEWVEKNTRAENTVQSDSTEGCVFKAGKTNTELYLWIFFLYHFEIALSYKFSIYFYYLIIRILEGLFSLSHIYCISALGDVTVRIWS